MRSGVQNWKKNIFLLKKHTFSLFGNCRPTKTALHLTRAQPENSFLHMKAPDLDNLVRTTALKWSPCSITMLAFRFLGNEAPDLHLFPKKQLLCYSFDLFSG